jgi:pimeloyl-ACP methyl ester carboxylesterase
MKKVVAALAVLVLAAIVLPPAYYALRGGAEALELPPRGRTVQLAGGAQLNLLDSERGPAIVLVHGLPGSAYDWRPLPERLAAGGARAIAYDRVGYGHSSRRDPGAEFTIEANADELLELLDVLELSDATLVGWSYGGGVVLRAALRRPGRIGRLVLLGSVGPGMELSGHGAAERILYSRPVLAWVSMIPPVSRAVVRSTSADAFSDQPMPEWWLPQLRANLNGPGTIETFLEEEGQFALDELDPGPLEIPVLVIHGDDDRLVSLAVGEDLYARARPAAKMVRVEGGSHMLPITHPDLLAQHILEFAN